MEVIFLGVGEACDERNPNTSLLIYQKDTCLLLDCGFSVAHEFFKHEKDPNKPDIVWISHFHGDHFLGLPLLVLRLWEEGREKPLYFIGQKGLSEKVTSAMKLAFPTLAEKISFDYIFNEIHEDEKIEIKGISFQGAYTEHVQSNLAIKLICGEKSLYYSGDGPPSEKCYPLAGSCDLIVQETFLWDKDIYGHGNFLSAAQFARKVGAKRLAAVHMKRDERDKIITLFEKNRDMFKEIEIYIPNSGDKITL